MKLVCYPTKFLILLKKLLEKSKKLTCHLEDYKLYLLETFINFHPLVPAVNPIQNNFVLNRLYGILFFPFQNIVQLTTIFRQNDAEYIDILKQVRIGQLDTENTKIIQKYLKRTYDPTLHNNCIPTKLFPLTCQN